MGKLLIVRDGVATQTSTLSIGCSCLNSSWVKSSIFGVVMDTSVFRYQRVDRIAFQRVENFVVDSVIRAYLRGIPRRQGRVLESRVETKTLQISRSPLGVLVTREISFSCGMIKELMIVFASQTNKIRQPLFKHVARILQGNKDIGVEQKTHRLSLR